MEREGFLYECDMDVSVQKTVNKIKFTTFNFFLPFTPLFLYKYHAGYNHSLTDSNSINNNLYLGVQGLHLCSASLLCLFWICGFLTSTAKKVNKCTLILIKAAVHVNRSEIRTIIKRELLGLKCAGNITRQLTTPNESPRLVGDSLQISIFQIHQIFNISYFPKFNLSFE